MATHTGWKAALTAALGQVRSALDGKQPVLVVTAQDFGAIGDGIADDTTAMQAMLNHLTGHGGVGVFKGTYRITSSLVASAGTGWTLRGFGAAASEIVTDFTAESNAINVLGPQNAQIEDFLIRPPAGKASTYRHGLSIKDARHTAVRRVHLESPIYSGATFHRATLPADEHVHNVIEDCCMDGGGIARNGFSLASATDSVIRDCRVTNLSRTRGPAYGLQLKNDCTRSLILGGTVDGASAGVAFGNDVPEAAATACVVAGVTVNDCTYGFLAGPSNSCDVQVVVAMGPTSKGAVRLNGAAVDNVVRVHASTPPSAGAVAVVYGLRNRIRIDGVLALGGAALIDIKAGAANNLLSVGQVSDLTGSAVYNARVINASSAVNNVVWDRQHADLAPMSDGAAGILRFHTKPISGWISFNPSTGSYGFRANGDDIVYINPSYLGPAVNGAVDLGQQSRGYKSLILASPDGSRWRVTVTNAGALAVAAA